MTDNDLIPDEWQAGTENSNVHKEYSNPAVPGSPAPAQPSIKPAEPEKKQGVLGRLFGFGRPKKDPGEAATFESPAKKADWNPIDFSKTPRITSGIYGARSSFENHVKKQLKSDLGSVLDASQRKEVADMMANKRGHGLRRDEVRKELRKMEESGKLNKFERKRIERKLGANKSSSFF